MCCYCFLVGFILRVDNRPGAIPTPESESKDDSDSESESSGVNLVESELESF